MPPGKAGNTSGGSGEGASSREAQVSELKRINALNLEPTFPKVGDNKSVPDRSTMMKQWLHNRNTDAGLKNDWKGALEEMKGRKPIRTGADQDNQASGGGTGASGGGGGGGDTGSAGAGAVGTSAPAATGNGAGGGASGGGANNVMGGNGNFGTSGEANVGGAPSDPIPKRSALRPTASPFSLSPQVQQNWQRHSPSGSSTAVAGGQKEDMGPVFQFPAQTALSKRRLSDILTDFLTMALKETPDSAEPVWPEATGSSYHELMGKAGPAQGKPPTIANAGSGAMPGNWQQPGFPQAVPVATQQPTAPGAPGPQGTAQHPPAGMPQMMQPGFMMVNPTWPPPVQGGVAYQSFMPMMSHPQGAVQQQGPQQQMVFNQQAMLVAQQPQQQMTMHPGMMGGQDQQHQMSGVGAPQFGVDIQRMGMPMMMGQFAHPGGMPQQGQVPGQHMTAPNDAGNMQTADQRWGSQQ